MTIFHTLTFQSASGPVSVPIKPGNVVLVAGPNGVGKSALLASLYRSLPRDAATYLPGHRQINFNNGWEAPGQDPAQLRLNLFSHADHFNRFKGAWAEDQFKLIIRTLINMEHAHLRTF